MCLMLCWWYLMDGMEGTYSRPPLLFVIMLPLLLLLPMWPWRGKPCSRPFKLRKTSSIRIGLPIAPSSLGKASEPVSGIGGLELLLLPPVPAINAGNVLESGLGLSLKLPRSMGRFRSIDPRPIRRRRRRRHKKYTPRMQLTRTTNTPMEMYMTLVIFLSFNFPSVRGFDVSAGAPEEVVLASAARPSIHGGFPSSLARIEASAAIA